MFEANEHQNYFFGRLLKKLGMAHDPSRSPLFAAFFNYESGRFARTLDEGRLTLTLNTDGTAPYRGPRDTSMFELYLNVAEQDGELLCECDYSTDLFAEETVSPLAGTLPHRCCRPSLLAVARKRNIWRLPLLDPDERRQILVRVERHRRGLPAGKMPARVDRRPDRAHAPKPRHSSLRAPN